MTFLMAALLAGCGGGGGAPGLSLGAAAVVGNKYPTLTAGLPDGGTNPTNSIATSGYTTLSVALIAPNGQGIPNQSVDVAPDDKLLFVGGNTSLTNANGVASFKVARASLLATGAGTLTISYSYKVGSIVTYPDGSTPPATAQTVTAYLGYQLAAANITLDANMGAATLPAYGTRQITVTANVNSTATTTPVLVGFNASCGQIKPTSTSTNSLGQAIVTYTATDAAGTTPSTIGCSGKTIDITASTAGATAVTRQLNITAAPATNLGFVDAAPTGIYLADSGGATQSIVRFKLTNARGEALLGQDVVLTLKTQTGGAVKATFGSVGNTAAVTQTTDSEGNVSIPVFSGTVPTNVIVNAALVSNPLVQTDSTILTIASGRPAQARASLAVGNLSIEGMNVDGISTTVTLSLADRQGNPVPDGTAINFVTEGGVMIPPVCRTGKNLDGTEQVPPQGSSQCSVTIRSQNPRPANGLVTILAYTAGEEDFVDANFNNVYDCGEAYTDLTTAYRDDLLDPTLTLHTFLTGQFSVPRAASPSTCGSGAAPSPTKGDGVWGAADVRAQQAIVFATSRAVITSSSLVADTVYPNSNPATNALVSVNVTVADGNGLSMPTGSTVEIKAVGDGQQVPGFLIGAECKLNTTASFIVGNSLTPATFYVGLNACVKGDAFSVTVTSPLKVVTEALFFVQ
jgi:hypothetical protein